MPKRVMVADDKSYERAKVTRYIQDVAPTATITEFSDGAPLVEGVRHGTCDLVLTDYQMPGMNGIEATRRIREFNQSVPVYVMSLNDVEKDALQSGATGFISKGGDRLGHVLRQHLG